MIFATVQKYHDSKTKANLLHTKYITQHKSLK